MWDIDVFSSAVYLEGIKIKRLEFYAPANNEISLDVRTLYFLKCSMNTIHYSRITPFQESSK